MCVFVYLIGEMSREVFGSGIVDVTRQSDIPMTKEDHVGRSGGNEKVRAHIKLSAI